MDFHRSVQTSGEIEQHADGFVRQFLASLAPAERPAVRLFFSEAAGGDRRAIRATVNNSRMELHVQCRDLLGIPEGALQGWLELAIATSLEQQRAANFNFQKQILPLMQVAGGALLYIRELVEHLSRSLQRRNVTTRLLAMGRGEPQVSYYFYTIHPSAEEKAMYEKSLFHNWSRASYLCGKLVEYMGLSMLAGHGVAFSGALLADWPKQHGYRPADQALLDELVALADRYADRAFAFRLVEMFKELRDRLLLTRSDADDPL